MLKLWSAAINSWSFAVTALAYGLKGNQIIIIEFQSFVNAYLGVICEEPIIVIVKDKTN